MGTALAAGSDLMPRRSHFCPSRAEGSQGAGQRGCPNTGPGLWRRGVACPLSQTFNHILISKLLRAPLPSRSVRIPRSTLATAGYKVFREAEV